MIYKCSCLFCPRKLNYVQKWNIRKLIVFFNFKTPWKLYACIDIVKRFQILVVIKTGDGKQRGNTRREQITY